MCQPFPPVWGVFYREPNGLVILIEAYDREDTARHVSRRKQNFADKSSFYPTGAKYEVVRLTPAES